MHCLMPMPPDKHRPALRLVNPVTTHATDLSYCRQPLQVALLLAVQGRALGGVQLRCQSSNTTQDWITLLQQLCGVKSVRVPVNCSHDQLVGGIDVAASLLGNGPVIRRGLLTQAHHASLVLPYAALHSAVNLRTICHVLDNGVVPSSTVVRPADGDAGAGAVPDRAANKAANGVANTVANSAVNNATDICVVALDPSSVDSQVTDQTAPDLGFNSAAATSPRANIAGNISTDQCDDVSEHSQINASLSDRLAFSIALAEPASIDSNSTLSELLDVSPESSHVPAVDIQLLRHSVRRARERLSAVVMSDKHIESICALAVLCGIESVRAQLYCMRVAQTSAALADRDGVTDHDIEVAVSLCFEWRATGLLNLQDTDQHERSDNAAESVPENKNDETARNTQEQTRQEESTPAEALPQSEGPVAANTDNENANGGNTNSTNADSNSTEQTDEQQIETAIAALPKDLLDALASSIAGRHIQVGKAGRSGGVVHADGRGRVIGSQRYRYGSGQKIDVLATLREAAPWQALRRQQCADSRQLIIHPQDLRAVRYKQSSQAVTVFAVDASGSSAAQRLAEARGAVELLLAECYVRRDQVALIVFQGAGAQLVLPPTRSLVRARRKLTQLPVGGGTPLPSALDLATQLGTDLYRSGFTPLLCLLTDGRANVDRDGVGGRDRALQQSLQSARRYEQTGMQSLVIDTSVRASAFTSQLAVAMGGAHLKLPRADAKHISKAISTVTQHAQSGAA